MIFSVWLRHILIQYIWDKVAWTFFFSIMAWFVTLILGNTVGLSRFIYMPDWSPPEILATIDKIFTILGKAALISTIMTGVSLLIKSFKSAISQMFFN